MKDQTERFSALSIQFFLAIFQGIWTIILGILLGLPNVQEIGRIPIAD